MFPSHLPLLITSIRHIECKYTIKTIINVEKLIVQKVSNRIIPSQKGVTVMICLFMPLSHLKYRWIWLKILQQDGFVAFTTRLCTHLFDNDQFSISPSVRGQRSRNKLFYFIQLFLPAMFDCLIKLWNHS